MAIATSLSIKYKCGHTQSTDLSKVPAGRRKAHAYGLGKNRVCGRCFAAGNAEGREAFLAERNAQTLAEAESFETDHDLPPLEGSEKQISWATRTRYEMLSTALEELTGNGAMSEEDFVTRIVEPARKILKPSWWIDNKDAEPADIEELVTTAVDEDELVETENPY
ncbi:hypothetical protein [Arthrobacter sp. 31Y]|uniref:hypothetical protein n=1 Tax=Arthrobacter sp. 31Y TaxID=1115632 RepID=UPI0004664FB2|nr:hypothetical protein [Arthrobacter sp. 31Y]